MTISELRLALDLGFENKAEVLKRYAKQMSDKRYLFIDSFNGEFYLFDVDGNEDDIAKLYRIGVALFYRDSGLKLVRIPENVTSIGNTAFWYCSGLTSVTILDSVTSIGSDAFNSCSELTSVTISDRVTNIGHMAFYNCINLKKLVFKGTTIDEIKSMDNYPWGIKDESIIKCES